MIAQLTLEGAWLIAGDRRYACSVGRGGTTSDKREGDLKTPTGEFALRWCYYRPDRIETPDTMLPLIALTPDDGWCDDVAHRLYNQPIKLPFEGRHEKLWRDDRIYDLIIPLGYNDAPPVPGRGSAIFLHLRRPDGIGTEGCVALELSDLLALLPDLSTQTHIKITAPVFHPAASPG